ncbi:MAG TPA: hypothetical protein VFZ65_14555 [Planctomycetota bacterium]|nr:hypothetical protein [Planctomycetota bacterium]
MSPPPIDPGVGEWRTLHHVDAFDTADILNDVLPPRWCRPVSGNVDPWCPIDPPWPDERPEIDAARRAVRWRGTPARIAEANDLITRLDQPSAHDPTPTREPELTFTYAHFVLQHVPAAELPPILDELFVVHSQVRENGVGRCIWTPALRCRVDPASNTLSVTSVRYYLQSLCSWLEHIDSPDWKTMLHR